MRRLAVGHSTLVAYLALFVALGGSAYAAVTVTGANIKNGTITGKDVKNRTLGTGKLSTKAVASLRGQAGPPGPQGPAGPATGPAGGDLSGRYPNPLIRPGAVGSGEIANEAVNGDKIADNSITTTKIAPGAITSGEIASGAVSSSAIQDSAVESRHIHSFAVGAPNLKLVIAVVGQGKSVTAGNPQTAEVECPNSHPRLIAGGHAWQDDEQSSIIYSAPSEVSPTTKWLVRGRVESGSNALFAWATCMAA